MSCHQPAGNCRRLLRRRFAPRRRGVITIEAIAVTSLLVLFAASIAEFAMAFRVQQRVASASEYGARLAARMPRSGTMSLGTFNTTDCPANLKSRIDAWLQEAGLSPSTAVLLEHNACGVANPVQLLPTTSHFPATSFPNLPTSTASDVNYVRVTVAVSLAKNVPNALKSLGLDWGTSLVRHSAVFRVESDNTPPTPYVSVDPAALASGDRVEAITTADGRTGLRIITRRGGIVPITLSGHGSQDAEDASQDLAFNWQSSAALRGAVNQPTVRSELTLPADADGALAEVTLTVTDKCQCSSSTSVPLEVIRNRVLPSR